MQKGYAAAAFSSSFEGGDNASHLSLDFLNLGSSIEVFKVTLFFVVFNDREGLGVETVKALSKGLGGIVLSMEEIFSSDVVFAFHFGRIESKMVRASTVLVYATSTNALLKDLLVTVESDNEIHLLSTLGHHFIKFLSLVDSPGESVE